MAPVSVSLAGIEFDRQRPRTREPHDGPPRRGADNTDTGHALSHDNQRFRELDPREMRAEAGVGTAAQRQHRGRPLPSDVEAFRVVVGAGIAVGSGGVEDEHVPAGNKTPSKSTSSMAMRTATKDAVSGASPPRRLSERSRPLGQQRPLIGMARKHLYRRCQLIPGVVDPRDQEDRYEVEDFAPRERSCSSPARTSWEIRSSVSDVRRRANRWSKYKSRCCHARRSPARERRR